MLIFMVEWSMNNKFSYALECGVSSFYRKNLTDKMCLICMVMLWIGLGSKFLTTSLDKVSKLSLNNVWTSTNTSFVLDVYTMRVSLFWRSMTRFNQWKQLWSRTFLQHYCYALDKTVLTLGNDRPNSNHRKTIVFALIIAFRNFENCGSIELMKISILFFKYWKFSPSDWNFQINLLFNELQFLGNGKVSLHIKMRTRF